MADEPREPQDRLDTQPRPAIRRLTPRHLMFVALSGLVMLIVISFLYAKRSFVPEPRDASAIAGPPAMEPGQIRELGFDETAPRPELPPLEGLLRGRRGTQAAAPFPAAAPALPTPARRVSPAATSLDQRLAAPLGSGSRRQRGGLSSPAAAEGGDELASERTRLLAGLERLDRTGAAAAAGLAGSSSPETLEERAGMPAIGLAEARFVVPREPFLRAGTLIPLLLLHQLDSRQPGLVRAQVTEDVLDATARTVVIPRGTLALGFQTGQPVLGQERLDLRWTQLHYPDHRILLLPESPAGAPDGSLGAEGRVDQRWRTRYGAALLLTLIGAGAQLSQPQRSAVAGAAASDGQIVAGELGLQFGRLSQEVLQRYVDLPPVVRLEPGARLALLTTENITVSID